MPNRGNVKPVTIFASDCGSGRALGQKLIECIAGFGLRIDHQVGCMHGVFPDTQLYKNLIRKVRRAPSAQVSIAGFSDPG
jgi:hypothetical protein